MSNVYIVNVQLQIPVLADSEQDAKTVAALSFMEAAASVHASLDDEDTVEVEFSVQELTEESEDFHEWRNIIPFAAGDDVTIGELLSDEQEDEQEDELPPEHLY